MQTVKLCRALQDAFLRMGAGQSIDHGDLFNELGWSFKTAADALERDEMARLGVVGQQPRGLMDLPLEGV